MLDCCDLVLAVVLIVLALVALVVLLLPLHLLQVLLVDLDQHLVRYLFVALGLVPLRQDLLHLEPFLQDLVILLHQVLHRG